MSPTHTRRDGKLYRYYVCQAALKGEVADTEIRRVSAGAIEAAVIDQLRALLKAPEVVMATWRAMKAEGAALSEATVREALERLDPLWEELFPAEQARIVQLLVQRVDLKSDGLELQLRSQGLGHVFQELGAIADGLLEGRVMPAPAPAIVTIKVPFAIRKRGGRKLVLAPDGAPMPPAAPQIDSTLVKAIARAFRWQKMLETGQYATIKEIAKAERINPSYVSRVLRLTLLAPRIVESIVDGHQQPDLTLGTITKPFPVAWAEQSTAMQMMAMPLQASV